MASGHYPRAYSHAFRKGDCIVSDEDQNFIPRGTVVVYLRDTFAPFVKLLVPGYTEIELGHFDEANWRRATPQEIHARLLR